MPACAPDAEELHSRAVAAGSAGRHHEAGELLAQARQATTDPDLLARIDLTAAYADGETGDPEAALARCRDVLGRAGLADHVRGLAHSQLGLLLMRRSEHHEALAELDRAIDRLAEPTPLAVAHLNRGNVHLQRARAAEASTDFAAAARYYTEARDEVGAAKAVFNQAYCQLLTGDLVGALRGMDDAGAVLAPLSAAHRATVEQDRAEVLRAAGRLRDAAAALTRAAEAYGVEGLRRYQAEAEYVLAGTLLVDDPERARALARTAARRFGALRNEAWQSRARAVAVVADIRCGNRARTLLREADRVTGVLHDAGHLRERDELVLAAVRLLVERGELDEAATRLRRVRARRDTPVTLRLQLREERARLHRARGSRSRALAEARTGLRELQGWQATFGSLDLRSTLVGHGQPLARLGLQEALSDGTPHRVLEWSERARALAAQVTPVRPPEDPELAADLAALRQLPPDERARREELTERIRHRAWYGAGGATDGGTVEEPVALEDLRARLAEDDAALVAPIVLGSHVHGLLVSDTDAAVVPLGDAGRVRGLLDRLSADLDTAAVHRSGGLGEAVRASLTADLQAVADQLVSPLLDLLGDRRLVLTPSALLAGCPWSLLPGLRGRPLTLPSSATRWHRLRSRPAPAVTRVGLVAGTHVLRAPEEVRRAASAWSTTSSGIATSALVDADATAARVSRLAGSVDLLHLAGHGQHAGEHPLFSAVQLYDGPWFGYDIDTLPHTPSTVVLSACELGRSSVRSSEETVGMTAAWLHAGAHTVVSSPALVADDVACDVLADWHQRVAAGATPAEALADALAEVTVGGGVAPFLCHGVGW